MERKNHNDYLDSILYIASKNAGNSEIAEYKSTTPMSDVRLTASDIIGRKREKGTGTRRTSISLKRRIFIAVAAALLVSLLAFGVVATRKPESAGVKAEYVMVKDYASEGLSVSYEFEDRIRLGVQPECEIPGVLNEKYINLHNGYYFAESCEFTYSYTDLSEDYSEEFPMNAEFIEVLVGGKYHGALVVYKNPYSGVAYSMIMWNDGRFAHSIEAEAASDVVVEIAQSIYE
jgi:hypothetical protein